MSKDSSEGAETPWTPGPWRKGSNFRVVGPHPKDPDNRERLIAQIKVAEGTWIQESVSNANLIAAAPELVELVREYAWGNPTHQTDKRADALLDKIYGKDQPQ